MREVGAIGVVDGDGGVAIQAVTVRFGLQAREQRFGVDAGRVGKADAGFGFAQVDVLDAERFGLQAQAGAVDEVFRRFRLFAEAVGEFGADGAKSCFVFCLRKALVEVEAFLRVVDVVGGQECGRAEFDGDARRVQLDVAAAVFEGGDAALQQVEVVADADLLDLAGLFVAEDFARAPDFEVLAGEQEAGAEAVEGGEGV